MAIAATAPAPASEKSLADLPWWEVYQDPALEALIRDALAANYDLRIAVSRLEQARSGGVRTGLGRHHYAR